MIYENWVVSEDVAAFIALPFSSDLSTWRELPVNINSLFVGLYKVKLTRGSEVLSWNRLHPLDICRETSDTADIHVFKVAHGPCKIPTWVEIFLLSFPYICIWLQNQHCLSLSFYFQLFKIFQKICMISEINKWFT